IRGLSLAEPMMIPTRGASTSISSNASSTSGIGSRVSGSASPVAAPGRGSTVSTSRSLDDRSDHRRALAGNAFGDAERDVVPVLGPVELDFRDRGVGTLAGLGNARAERGHVEDAATGGDDLAVAPRRPGVGHLD